MAEQDKILMTEQDKILSEVTQGEYKYGFFTDIEMETIPKGLSEDVVRMISAKKNEPEFMLEFRLDAYRKWLEMEAPQWAHLKIPEINYQDIIYYAAPKQKAKLNSLDEVDPELLKTFEKLGIPLEEQKHLAGVAVDAVMDSVSVKNSFRETLAELGINTTTDNAGRFRFPAVLPGAAAKRLRIQAKGLDVETAALPTADPLHQPVIIRFTALEI